MKHIFVLSLALLLSAFTVDKTLPDTTQEARAQHLFRELKCVVCQGQPLNESDAALAQDMRQLIRQKIRAGATDAEITTYLKTRYGADIATTPPLTLGTMLLWLGPFLLLGMGIALFMRHRSRH